MRASLLRPSAGMIAVDTNIVVRYLTNDHPQQSAKAHALVKAKDIFLSKTVLLECEWVLRSVYGYSSDEVNRALRAFIGLPTASVESPGIVAHALDLAKNGLDFADALHVAAALDCETFVTFDRDFARRAKRVSLDRVSML